MMTLIPERGPNACTPHPRINRRRQEGLVRIVFQDVFPAARSAAMTSRISRNSRSMVSADSPLRMRVRTAFASSCLSFSINHRGDSSRNQIPATRMRPGMFWNASGNRPTLLAFYAQLGWGSYMKTGWWKRSIHIPTTAQPKTPSSTSTAADQIG